MSLALDRAARQADAVSAAALRVAQVVEAVEGRWLDYQPTPEHRAERGTTTAYLARTAAYLRFVRTLYQNGTLSIDQVRLMRTAAERVATLADERLDALTADG